MKDIKTTDICDGCGWVREIVFVSEYGQGFCKECIDNNMNRKLS